MTTRGKERAPHLVGAAAGAPRPTIDIGAAGDTPILREYRAVKAQFPDAIVLVRLGDFFEMFGADAERAAPLLGVALTGRSFGSAGRLPMCGVPHQAVAQHLRRLIDSGLRVALWDQVGDVIPGKLVQREITRVLSPGTAVDADLLAPSAVSRCVGLLPRAGVVGIAALDASTGDLALLEVPSTTPTGALNDELRRLDAAELIVLEDGELPEGLAPEVLRTRLPAALFDAGRADARLLEATGAAGVDALGAENVPVARAAAGAVLAYCERARLALSPELLRVRVRDAADLRLDAHTTRNLELLAAAGNGASLVELLDRTRTPMGARLLRAWVRTPLVQVAAIRERADAVAALARSPDPAARLEEALRSLRDLERLVARCVQRTASPRDLAAVRDACAALPRVRAAVGSVADAPPLLRTCGARCEAPGALLAHLERLLVPDPPAHARDGGCVQPGADPELDRMLAAGAGARSFIATLEQRERERTGMRSLRVGYNRVFGYYIEVPNGQRDGVPADYERKQTLVGAERYVTADLKEQEAAVLHSRDRALAREAELLGEAAAAIASHATALASAAAAAATLDVLQSLARVAHDLDWVRPEIDDSEVIDIEQGRHPLVERALGPGRFVPNDCTLDAAERILILTGPNMAGKSTYLRQVALTVVLAQTGSFIPAVRARIGVCDRVFTRIGAQDDLSGGMSTFMVEMAETAAILRQATSRSLVILDEIGRGTSTYDGLSIAQAVVEHLHDSPQLGCRTLFATHYHELTALAGSLSRVRNARVEVVEEGETVTFLHRIVPGGADRSFGIHVAKLAGLPASVLIRARTLLADLERSRPLAADTRHDHAQLSLDILAPMSHPVVDELAGLDIETMSPLAALNKLAALKQRAGS